MKNLHLSPFLFFSILLHLFVVLFALMQPEYWRWFVGAIICDHLTIIIAGFLPRTHILGENWTRLPLAAIGRGECALTIDDGPHPDVTPQVLAILDAYGVKATFFCIAQQAETYPELCREIVRRGHAVENHTYHHGHYFSLILNTGRIRAEIATAQNTLTAITGIKPLFFRPTAGLRNFLLDPILFRLDLRLASWTRRGFDTRQTDPQIVLKRLLKNLAAGDILLLHDNHCARTASGVPVILEVLPLLLEAIKSAHLNLVTLRATL